jgi:hypothetical protein
LPNDACYTAAVGIGTAKTCGLCVGYSIDNQ